MKVKLQVQAKFLIKEEGISQLSFKIQQHIAIKKAKRKFSIISIIINSLRHRRIFN